MPWARKPLQRGSPWLQRRNSPRPRQLDDTPPAPSRNSRSSVLRSSAGGCLSSRLLEREIPHPRALAKGLRRNLREQAQRAQRVRASLPSVLGQAAPCLSGATACARARALLGGWSTHWRPQGPAARSNCRYACWNTECAGRSSGRWCKSWEHSAAHRQRVGAETGLCGDSPGRFRVEPSDRKFSGGIRGLFRGPVLPRGVRGWKTRETGAGGKGGENSQREARGGHCCSRRQGTQGPQRPRGRIMVLAQTRRRVLGACFHCVATSAASEGSSP